MKVYLLLLLASWGFPYGSAVKNLLANARDAGDSCLIPGSGRSAGRGNGNPLQYSSVENPMDRGAWWATIHGVAKSWTQLSDGAHTSRKVLTTACYCHKAGKTGYPQTLFQEQSSNCVSLHSVVSLVRQVLPAFLQ